MNKRLIIGSVLATLLVSTAAFAQTSPPPPDLKGMRRDAGQQFKRGVRTERKDALKDIRTDREGTRGTIQQKRVDTEKMIREKRHMMSASTTPEERAKLHEEVVGERKKFKEERDDLLQKFHIEAKTRRDAAKEKIAQYRTQLKEKLTTIRDERKKIVAERLDTRFEEVQDKYVGHFQEVLKRLEAVLEKIDTRADTLAAAGKDTTKVESAVSAARGLIDEAKKKVTDYAGKTYPIVITTEDKLGEAVSKARRALHDDTVVARDAVQKARQATEAALQELKLIPEL